MKLLKLKFVLSHAFENASCGFKNPDKLCNGADKEHRFLIYDLVATSRILNR